MSTLAPDPSRATHEVVNQAPPLAGRNLFEDNLPLVEALEREGGGWARARASQVGARWGGEPVRWGFLANENPPRLQTHDRVGNRIDEVEFHPAWHDLMRQGIADEMHSLAWTADRPGAHVARAAL
jgi:putative acyl-CoA dehydrogenase